MHKNILTTIGTRECMELSYNTSKPVKHKSHFHFYPPLVFLLVQEKHSEREKSCSFIFTHLISRGNYDRDPWVITVTIGSYPG